MKKMKTVSIVTLIYTCFNNYALVVRSQEDFRENDRIKPQQGRENQNREKDNCEVAQSSKSKEFCPSPTTASTMAGKLVSTEFTVYGKVQGVFFRKHTMSKANELGVRGWCQNTREGTVVGVIEGMPDKVNTMKTWLEKTVSPKSRIDKAAEFRQEKNISDFTFKGFQIQK